MEELQKSRIKGVNIVFLVTILIQVIVPFLPLDFLSGRIILCDLLAQVLLALPVVIYMVVNRISYTQMVRFRRMRIPDMLLALLFGILLQPVQSLISALSLVFATDVISDATLDTVQAVPFLGGIFVMAVVPAVVEETVFRGMFYNEYSKVHILKAALLSGFLFGVVHGNINQFCYAFFMGSMFALLIEATGSILSSMLVHFWLNAYSTVIMYLNPILYKRAQAIYNMYKEYGNEAMATALEGEWGNLSLSAEEWMQQFISGSRASLTVPQVLLMYGPLALITGVLAFLVYKKLALRNGNWYRICASFKPQPKCQKAEEGELQPEKQPKQRMVTVPLVIGMLLGVAYMIFYEILLHKAGL